MKKIRYTLFPDLAGGFYNKQESVLAFLQDTLILNKAKIIPPLDILNSIFMRVPDISTGRTAEWEPFEISKLEYGLLVKELELIQGLPYRYELPPETIKNAKDWLLWQGYKWYAEKPETKYRPYKK